MTDKEKITTLVNMGFSIDEAMALAAGNYRTVPDGTPEPKQDHKQEEPKPDRGPEDPKQDPEKEEPEQKPSSEPWERIEQALAKLTQSVIQSNINNKQQPQPMTAQDVLGLMLEPRKPAERS